MSTSGKAAGGPPTGPAGGDIAGTGSSTYPNPTLTALGAAAGPIGSSTVAPVVTIDTKGRVTALTQATITPPGISVATVTLNTAAIKAMFTAPTTVVAAPGAGKLLVPILGVAQFAPTAATLGNAPGEQTFYYTATPTFATRALGITSPGIIDSSAAAFASVALYLNSSTATFGVNNVPFVQSAVVNKAITFGAGNAGAGVIDVGPVVTSTKQAGGALYAPGDTGTIDVDIFAGSLAAYVVDTVDGGGAVLTYHLTAAGNGYSTVDNPLATTAGGAQAGIGTGFTVNVTAVTAFAGNLYATLYYTTLTLT